ncbi:Mitochondria fission 1 protein [Zancudomyces culisetae]|uniref:Mitochondrial fission 1 protein n=1 Tax=Zancudomyces culisetae TaxID=1213189 RepID=A0A1R1PY22_ZANCU|nr:Mitochondria fission 1 protein [Zancudomyces culisetae]|eukprot:OMH85817.1 Mitochondria fission 1 protein [Zancudomyces culisetae]
MYNEKDDLPYAIDAETALTQEELLVSSQKLIFIQITQDKEEKNGEVTVQTKFNYAWGLVKSNKSSEQELGVQLLEEIFEEYPERQRECLYYISLGHYKLGNYSEANRYNDTLINIEPENKQALSLKRLIEKKCTRDGAIGMAIAGGAVAAIGVIVASLLHKRN